MTRTILIAAALAAAGTLTSFSTALGATPGTSFTYQGLLEESGAPVTTAVDVRFTLYSDAGGTSQVGSPQTASGVTPDDGVFSASVDFGASAFADNEARWMRVEVSPAGAGTYDDLGIQALEASPFALNTRGIAVDASGNVGVGTSTPAGRLDIDGVMALDHSGSERGLYASAPGNFLRFLANNDTRLAASDFLRLHVGGVDRALLTRTLCTMDVPLTVNGEIESVSGGFMFPDGTVQTTAAYASTTEQLRLGPGDFVSSDSSVQVFNNWTNGCFGTGSVGMIAPIHLPVGARITGMTVHYRDDAAGELRFEILAKINGSGTANGVGYNIETSGAGYTSESLAGNHTTFSDRHYLIRVLPINAGWPGNDTLSFQSVVIEWSRP